MLKRMVSSGLVVLSVMLCACSHSQGGSTSGPPATGLPSEGEISALPMGHIAGFTDSAALARSIPNPYEGNAQAVAAGKSLYIKMNCAGCHAYNAKGNMGPDLTDTYWRYGGLPAQIYASIHDGRAQGMPAWGAALPPQEMRTHLDTLKRQTEAEGRDFSALTISYKAALYDVGIPSPDESRRPFSGRPAEIADDISTFAAIGVHELIFDFRGQSMAESVERLQRFAAEVLPLAG